MTKNDHVELCALKTRKGKCFLPFLDLLIDSISTRGGMSKLEVSIDQISSYDLVPGDFLSLLHFDENGVRTVTRKSIKFLQVPLNSSPSHLLKAMRAMLEVLLDYDEKFCDKISMHNYFSFFRNALAMSKLEFMKHMKYLTVFPFALYTQQEVEDSLLPNPWIFTGRVREYLKRRLVGHDARTTRLWWSWLQGVKRGCEFANSECVEQSYEKHKKSMCTLPVDNSAYYYGDVRTKMDELARNFQIKREKMYQYTGNACYENKRSHGGALDYLLKEYARDHSDLFRYTHGNHLLRMFEGDFCQVKEVRGFLSYSYSELRWETLYEEVYDESSNLIYFEGAQERRIKCETYAVLEPLKIRMITKGEAKPYALCKYIQRSLWDYLQEFPQFALTGETLSKYHIYELDQMSANIEKELNINFTDYVSGDYSAATDNIDAITSNICLDSLLTKKFAMEYCDEQIATRNAEVIFNENLKTAEAMMDTLMSEGDLICFDSIRDKSYIGNNLPVVNGILPNAKQTDEKVAKSVLAPHEVHYPDGSSLQQTNGQLMGSILSFPILCFVNLIAYWRSLEIYTGKILSHEKLPCLINGDDILFKTNKDHYEIWKMCIKESGFQLSIGKNYVHPELLTVNSRLFGVKKGVVREYPYFNVGLLMGVAKVMENDTPSDETKRVADNYAIVTAGAINKVRAHHRFIKYYKSILPRGPENWFLPSNYGGLGLEIIEELESQLYITEYQHKLAQKCFREMDCDVGYRTKGRKTITGPSDKRYKTVQPVFGPYLENVSEKRDTSIFMANIDITRESSIVYRGSKAKDVETEVLDRRDGEINHPFDIRVPKRYLVLNGI